jgi:hypothetical protein
VERWRGGYARRHDRELGRAIGEQVCETGHANILARGVIDRSE